MSTEILAGSIRRGADEAEDEVLGRRLLNSAKDAVEHDICGAFGPGAAASVLRDPDRRGESSAAQARQRAASRNRDPGCACAKLTARSR